MIINKEKKFIFVHVFRTGGSSIDRAFGGNTKGYDTHTRLESLPKWQNYFSFGFVRNPWDRMVSGYMYQTAKKTFTGTFSDYINRFTFEPLCTTKKYAQYAKELFLCWSI